MEKTRPFSLEEHRCAFHVVQGDPEPDLLCQLLDPSARGSTNPPFFGVRISFGKFSNKRFICVQNSLLLHVFNRKSSFPDTSRIQRTPNADAQNDLFYLSGPRGLLMEFSKPRNCVEIKDSKFLYSSPIFWFGLHSRCEHPMWTWSGNFAGVSGSTSFINLALPPIGPPFCPRDALLAHLLSQRAPLPPPPEGLAESLSPKEASPLP